MNLKEYGLGVIDTTDLLPVDVTQLLHEQLRLSHRGQDGLLHPSSHLVAPLRHTQLEMAGAPQKPTELLSDIRLEIGSHWHRLLGEGLMNAGLPIMREVNLTPWLFDGWGGTADFLQWHPAYEAFALWDLKTIKGDGLRWVDKDGVKEAHHWQASSYWHAANTAGFPLLKTIGVYYLPISDSRDSYDLSPRLIELEPLPLFDVKMRMRRIKKRVDEYLEQAYDAKAYPGPPPDWLLQPSLEPPQPREQKVYWVKAAGHFEVKLVPHWTAAYCPYPDELCNCGTEGTTKIGHYSLTNGVGGVKYFPRKGYEGIEPAVLPDDTEILKRQKETSGSFPG